MDAAHLAALRANVTRFMEEAGRAARGPARLLDVAPQVHHGARPFFDPSIVVETLDIDPGSGCTYVGDLCDRNPTIPDGRFDYIVCTEVLEHTLRPFDAVREMHRMLRPGGLLFLSVPFNFRIHGPLPDCWRFTEHGLRALLAESFEILELTGLETPDRPLMPIHYTVTGRRLA
jgi:SAM-dependent methyltransferase